MSADDKGTDHFGENRNGVNGPWNTAKKMFSSGSTEPDHVVPSILFVSTRAAVAPQQKSANTGMTALAINDTRNHMDICFLNEFQCNNWALLQL